MYIYIYVCIYIYVYIYIYIYIFKETIEKFEIKKINLRFIYNILFITKPQIIIKFFNFNVNYNFVK